MAERMAERTAERIEHAPDLTILRASNPSAMTLDGTRTYVLGTGRVAIIDPGPDDPEQLAALAEIVGDRTVIAVLLTHAHADHSALAVKAAREFGCPLSASAETLSRLAGVAQGAGVAASPSREPLAAAMALEDGGRVEIGDGLELTALATPGHSADHFCYLERSGRRLFTGDLVLGAGSSAILHPDGNVGACLASLARLAALRPAELLPGHGPPVADAQPRLAEYRKHRLAREVQIRAALAAGATGVTEIRERVYGPLPPELAWAADASVAAHLAALEERGEKVPDHEAFGVGGEEAPA
jgi:hydroxyacylglutathione hydrolase